MSKQTENNIETNHKKSEIYENLPCHQSLAQQNARDHHEIEIKKQTTKEVLYAIPVHKTDRPTKRSNNEYLNQQKTIYTQIQFKTVTASVDTSSNPSSDKVIESNGNILIDNDKTNAELEDRRIRNFLRDASQQQQQQQHHKSKNDRDGSNFSFLTKEEHFANLVQQNVIIDHATGDNTTDDGASLQLETLNLEENYSLAELEARCDTNLEYLTNMNNKECSPNKQMDKMSDNLSVDTNGGTAKAESTSSISPKRNLMPYVEPKININREWVMKKIAMCLEQRSAGKKPIPLPPGMDSGAIVKNGEVAASSSFFQQNANPVSQPHLGCLILGSNGSGKTTICENILEAATGTRGILNRRLLSCYFINSQNPDCHNLSMFIRSMVLQILSHSSYIEKDDVEFREEEEEIVENLIDLNVTPLEVIKSEDTNEKDPVDVEEIERKGVHRQNSEPTNPTAPKECPNYPCKTNPLPTKGDPTIISSKPPLPPPNPIQEKPKETVLECESEQQANHESKKSTPNSTPSKKVSKIPKLKKDNKKSETSSNGKGTPEPELVVLKIGEEKESPKNIKEIPESQKYPDKDENQLQTETEVDVVKEENSAVTESKEEQLVNLAIKEETQQVEEKENDESTASIPPPLPKLKSCRMLIANQYYEMLVNNAEIFDSLNVDNIEKNPDECFKKVILFPLLELTPPKSALLLIVDSIDENYINEGNLITTLKSSNRSGGGVIAKSKNIAELLSNHFHLFPKWLFLVCTAKKQNKYITKMFNGFKKITLDDLRKSHVVKDVQEYIINRLNTDFKGMFNLTKDVIENLNQLYIKSNGCILYLQKVLNGIKEGFFAFREIKLIPCTLNGLYLFICQKSFNKKQYNKIRPILNILLACSDYADENFVFNCLRMHNFTIDHDEFKKRLAIMNNVLKYEENSSNKMLKIFHNSFCDWLVDVKFSTKKFLCDVNEGHVMISMYYTIVSDTLCPNVVRRYIYHLIKSGEYLTNKSINVDLILILLESKTNLSDCFYTNLLNCCRVCENECKNDPNLLPKTRGMIEKFLYNELNPEFVQFLIDFFKPNLPTDAKTLKLLIETGINNAVTSRESSLLNSPEHSDKSQNIDSELAELLISSERSCHQEIQRVNSLRERRGHVPNNLKSSSGDVGAGTQQLSDVETQSNGLDMHNGEALIHILAKEGNHVLLERALKACKDPIDLEIEDVKGHTALNIGARNGYVDVVKILMNFKQTINDGTGRLLGIDVNHPDRDGWTPLRSASWGGHVEIVKMLISHQKIKIDLADREGRTALRAAAWSGHEDILKILLEAGANVNSVDKQGRTSLIAASYMGHFDIVEILLENGSDVNHPDIDGRSALCVAASCGSSGYNKVISTLLEHGANPNQVDVDGMTPLLISSFEGSAEICELLLENGADPDLADQFGRTPLWAACKSGHANVVKVLLFWGCGIDFMDSEGRTVLSISAAQGNLATVTQLLDRGLDETHRDNAGWTPLHYAAFEGFADVCVQLLESGAKIDECDNEGKTALHLAAQEGHNGVVEALLDIHSAFIDQRAHDGKTAFRLACLEGHFECIHTLLKYGSDVNSKDADSRTTLYILALDNKLKMVKFLFEFANGDVNIPDAEGRAALHVASWQGHVEMVKLLITVGNANVNAMDLEHRSPLHSCAWQGNFQVMEILLVYGAIADHACKQGATALGICAQEGHEECVKILLQYGADPFKCDHCGRTPIKLAAKSNRNNVYRILENFTKNDHHVDHKMQHHPNILLKSPDKPTEKQILLPVQPNNSNLLMPNHCGAVNTTNSGQSSNFYENTMHSDNSSLAKRKSVVSNQSTESSNDAPISFTQQLLKHSKHNGSRSSGHHHSGSSKYEKNSQKFTQILPNLNEYQTNIAANISSNDADMFDCMSPLYATPPHSPSSDISSPGQHTAPTNFGELMGNHMNVNNNTADQHFARDTHMRIILGNNKDCNAAQGKSKRSGIATNPAVRMIRSRFDSAAQVIRRANNILNISSSNSNNQGSSSIGVKSSTFQWRKESQM